MRILFSENERPPNDQSAYVLVRFYYYDGPNINGCVTKAPITK